MRRRAPVADRLAHHHGPKAAPQRIDRGRPYAAAGGTAGGDQRIHALAVEPRREIGAEGIPDVQKRRALAENPILTPKPRW